MYGLVIVLILILILLFVWGYYEPLTISNRALNVCKQVRGMQLSNAGQVRAINSCRRTAPQIHVPLAKRAIEHESFEQQSDLVALSSMQSAINGHVDQLMQKSTDAYVAAELEGDAATPKVAAVERLTGLMAKVVNDQDKRIQHFQAKVLAE